MNFKLEDAPAIINTLKYYYQEKNMEQENMPLILLWKKLKKQQNIVIYIMLNFISQ